MGKSCLTCTNYVDNCSLGENGERYCKEGIDFDLWERDEQKEIAAVKKSLIEEKQKKAEEVQKLSDAQNTELGLDAFSEEVVKDEAEKILSEIDEKYKEPKEQKSFEGYNGIPKLADGEVRAYSCIGCKNSDCLVGCFLNKYTECVSNGRYIYESKDGKIPPVPGLEGAEDQIESDDAFDMVQKLLGKKDKRGNK